MRSSRRRTSEPTRAKALGRCQLDIAVIIAAGRFPARELAAELAASRSTRCLCLFSASFPCELVLQHELRVVAERFERLLIFPAASRVYFPEFVPRNARVIHLLMSGAKPRADLART